jgi:hypothetical protein
VVKVKVKDTGPILVDTTPAEDLIQGAVNLSKGYRPASHKAFAVFLAFGS